MCLEPGCKKTPAHFLMLYCPEHNAEKVREAHERGFHEWCDAPRIGEKARADARKHREGTHCGGPTNG
jgi:hypothetical protein